MQDADDWINGIIRDFFGDGPIGGAIKRGHKSSRRYYDNSDDIMEDEDEVYISFELRYNDDDYEIIPRDEVVIIYLITANDQIVYRLPCKVDPKSMKYTHNNYVMDIVLKKVKEEKIDDDEWIWGSL